MPLPRDEAVAVLTAFHDLLERADREGSAAFERAFHQPPPGVGVHEIELEHVVTRVSREELRILGYTEEQMLGHRVWEFIVSEPPSRRRSCSSSLPPERRRPVYRYTR